MLRGFFVFFIFVLMSSCVMSMTMKDIKVGTEVEKEFLILEHSALHETGVTPDLPFIRIADGETMYYIYKFAPGKGNIAYLQLWIRTQFLASVSTDQENWTKVSDMDENETIGRRVLIDLTPFLKDSDVVFVKFEDKYKQDGWGSLLYQILYFTENGKADVSRKEITNWVVNNKAIKAGESVNSKEDVVFNATMDVPAGWEKTENAIYLPKVLGNVKEVYVNENKIELGKTWDLGLWANISKSLEYGNVNKISVIVSPENEKAGIYAPARIGVMNTACAAPTEKTIDGNAIVTKRTQAPYTYDKLNYIAGNYTNYLFDDRYNLLAFEAAEKMDTHYLHDTSRNICALAEEERFTPVVRLELAKKLYEGIKGGILPGGEYMLSFKHDKRPLDIRAYDKEADKLTMVHKMDLWLYVATVGISAEDNSGQMKTVEDISDTKVVENNGAFTFSRTWESSDRSITSFNQYYHGGMDTPPAFNFQMDGKGKTAIDIGSFNETGFWFTPGTWGPEAIVFPNGKSIKAVDGFDITNPDFDYMFIRGGNGLDITDKPDYSGANAIMIMWDKKPDRIYADIAFGEDKGRWGALITDLHLVYGEETKNVKVNIVPFMGMPESMKTPIAISENIKNTGKYGMGFYDAHVSCLLNGVGADGFAAAAYLLKKYNDSAAKEAEELAVNVMKAFIELDKNGTRTQELYYPIKAVTYLDLIGHSEFNSWAKEWADRCVAAQKEDGSWIWLNWQLRIMSGLLHAYELLGDEKYLESVKKGMETLSYDENTDLVWQGEVDYYNDFSGALTINLFGYFGDLKNSQKTIDSRLRYIDDGGYSACSDLNPYMLGLSAKGMNLKTSEKKIILGLKDSVIYDKDRIVTGIEPTAVFVNPHHPLAKDITFKLVE